MQKIIEIKCFGQESSFKPTKINRSKLYGSKKRINERVFRIVLKTPVWGEQVKIWEKLLRAII